ncbi:hypothetical protein [Streptomyces albogriseolus]|uniref:hypothetical protein n=1 Tax=Streptomyces albogriseolus TaxID=1887 RepID=UPI002252F130|nr:hypothetical protein [Streptomyces viridodiastaticus]MCX4625054.1 hypothetical protein [Streptomyces viridodiastaticus]
MTYDFGLRFTQELGNRFGSPTGSWPATAERVTPFLAIVVDALGTTACGGSRPHTRLTGA